MFNKCFATGQVPSVWNKVMLKPIPKGSMNDPYTPLNYRTISLISNVAKLYSPILNDRIVGFYETVGLMNEQQYGLRKG